MILELQYYLGSHNCLAFLAQLLTARCMVYSLHILMYVHVIVTTFRPNIGHSFNNPGSFQHKVLT